MIWIRLLRQYLINVLYAGDVLLNAMIGGDPRETISSRAGKGREARKPLHTAIANIIDWVFWVVFREREHCLMAINNRPDTHSISTLWSKHTS